MAGPEAAPRSWWATLPGVLTALAGIITALAGLFAVLGQQGVLGGKAPAAPTAPMAAVAPAEKSAAPPANSAPAIVQQGASTQLAVAPAGTAQAQTPGSPSQSPAQVVAGLRAQGFKGLAVTAKDGSVISLLPTAEIHGQAFPLNSGQKVEFDRIVSVDIEQPWDGRVKITLTNGQQLIGTTGSYMLSGTNELGRYMGSMPDIRRIEFIR